MTYMKTYPLTLKNASRKNSNATSDSGHVTLAVSVILKVLNIIRDSTEIPRRKISGAKTAKNKSALKPSRK